MRISPTVQMVLLLAIVGALLYAGFVWLPGMNCQARAEAMQTNFYFHPSDGCYFQNGAGDWYRVDAATINQP